MSDDNILVGWRDIFSGKFVRYIRSGPDPTKRWVPVYIQKRPSYLDTSGSAATKKT